MIIILSWPFQLFLVGVWVAFSVLGAVLYGIQNSWDDDRVKWLKTFTAKQKWGTVCSAVNHSGRRSGLWLRHCIS